MASTSKKQRIFIWTITIVMTFGTILSFLVMIVASQNSVDENKAMREKYAKYQNAVNDYQNKVSAQAKDLSSKYYESMKVYSTYPAKFDKSSVTQLSTKDLAVGSGEEITSNTKYSAYYIGWNPDGVVFDQSIDSTTNELKIPIQGGNLITGWNEGVIGMKIGGVRELTIPSDKAYGDKSPTDLIPANTPLKFIVMVIPTPEAIEQPNPKDYI